MSRTPVATDNFNRASLNATYTNWAQLNYVTPNFREITISGSTIAVGGGESVYNGDIASARYVGTGDVETGQTHSGTIDTANQYASLRLKGLGNISTAYNQGVLVRCSSATGSSREFYGVSVISTGTPYSTIIFKCVAGTYTPLSSGLTHAWVVNDLLELEVEGWELRVCKNGTALGESFTVTDGGQSIATGLPGIQLTGSVNTPGDDFSCGSITSASTPIARNALRGLGSIGQGNGFGMSRF